MRRLVAVDDTRQAAAAADEPWQQPRVTTCSVRLPSLTPDSDGA